VVAAAASGIARSVGGGSDRTALCRWPLNWRRNAARLFARQTNGRSAIDHAPAAVAQVYATAPARRPSHRLIANYCSRHLIISVRHGVRPSSARLSAAAAAAAAAAVRAAAAAFLGTFAVHSLASDKERVVRFSEVTSQRGDPTTKIEISAYRSRRSAKEFPKYVVVFMFFRVMYFDFF